MKDRYTRVLKGHIAVSTAVFPKGTTGDKIDALARASLREAGLDYAHGTGHGVGSYLSVHEGPCGISPLSKTVPLEQGMILSDEPGYYKTGEYGIRIENLVLVVDKEDGMLGFKPLTLAPIDRALIDLKLLTADEQAWLDAYHANVRDTLLPLVEDKTVRAWLERQTRPL
jgi:Xaa-Pro aminopeptidase